MLYISDCGEGLNQSFGLAQTHPSMGTEMKRSNSFWTGANNVLINTGLRSKIIPYHVEGVIIGILSSRIFFFSLSPFFPILFAKDYALDVKDIGLIISIAGLASVFASLLAGPILDRLGTRRVMIFGIVCYVGSSVCAMIGGVWTLMASVALLNTGKLISDTAIKAHLSELNLDPHQYEESLQYRYLADNLGALFGPLVFSLAGQGNLALVSLAAILAFFGYWRLYSISSRSVVVVERPQARRVGLLTSIVTSLAVVMRDGKFLLCAGYGAIIIFALTQMTTTLSQYFVITRPQEAVFLTSLVVMTNALAVVFLHPVYLKFRHGMSLNLQIYVGNVALLISQAILAALMFDAVPVVLLLLLAVVIFAVADLLLMPLYTYFINEIAPAHRRGSYFAMSSLYVLGSAVGPFAGAALLDAGGIGAVFLATAALTLLGAFFQILLLRELSKTDASTNTPPA